MFDKKQKKKKKKNREYFLDSTRINGESFVTAYYCIRDIHGNIIGYMGIANSKAEINRTKFLTIIIIMIITMLIIMVGVFLNTLISYRIAKPLMKLQETANRIAFGRYGESFEKTKETNEIDELSEKIDEYKEKSFRF